jgi:hypothetical protein
MISSEQIRFLRGSGDSESITHPVLRLTEEELRRVIGGVDGAMASSTMTGSYGDSVVTACCDGTQVCCCNN